MYATLTTRNPNGLHPNLRGLGAYTALKTSNPNGLNPNFRGLGDMPTTSFTLGPGGQFAVSTVSTPTSTSLGDQILSWFSQSSIYPGMPNSVFAIGGVIVALVLVMKGRR